MLGGWEWGVWEVTEEVRVSVASINKLEKITRIREREEQGQALDVAFLAQVFTRCHMPMTDPKKKNVMVYERRDGDKTLRFKADVDTKYGLMYGSDFLTLAAFMTKAREQMNDPDNVEPEKIVFPSTAQMLQYLGLEPNGKNYRAMLKSIARIQDTTVELVEILDRMGAAERVRRRKGGFIQEATLWFNMNKRQIGMKGCENVVILSHELMTMLKKPNLLEFDKLMLSRKEVGQLQLFSLLRSRCSAPDLEEMSRGRPADQWPTKACAFIPVHGPNSLESQLGWLKTPPEKEVRRQVKRWLTGIRAGVWPECPGEMCQGQDGHWRLKVWYAVPLQKSGKPRK
jgi:Replication initiator protein A